MRSETALRLPYPGLRSFRRDEADLFFGREDCINGMVDRLAATQFLAVLGSSGTGKSSLVKTGLLDALDLGLMASAGSAWRVVELKPGTAPLKNLALGLLETRGDGAEVATKVLESEADLLRAFLLRGPLSVAEWCADGHLPEHTNLLLLVDQFEELFRYQDYSGREEAEAFAALLLESARQSKVPIYVTLTMRSEYLGACALINGLAEAISAGLVLIPRMTREQCRSAIVGSAAVCGFKIADDLTNRLLNDLVAFAPWDDHSTRDQLDRLTRRADQLPLLQYCLNRMWTRARTAAGDAPIVLTLTDYDRIGGLGGALNTHADEVLRDLGEDCRPVAEAVFRALTEGSTASDAVRRPTRFDELVAICNSDEARVHRVVDAFRAPGCNFLAPGLDAANPRPLAADTLVDISHESLIRQWKQLSEWVEAEERARRQWRRLKDRFQDKQPLQAAELANMQAWRREQKPNAHWARRYGGDFPLMMAFIERSERGRRRFAPLILPCLSFSLFVPIALILIGAEQLIGPESTAGQTHKLIILMLLLNLSAASACAFGAWRYADVGRTWALLAGIGVLVLWTALVAGPVAVVLSSYNYDFFFMQWLNAPIGAVVVATVLAIFVPAFRSYFVWISTVGPFVFLERSAFKFSEDNPMPFLLGWLLLFAVVGCHFRWAGATVSARRQRQVASFTLALLAFSTLAAAQCLLFIISTIAPDIPSDWRWILNVAAYAVTIASTYAFALNRYRGLNLKTTLWAAAAIFMFEFVAGNGAIALLSAYGVPIDQAGLLAGLIVVAPCAVAGLAIFDHMFRKVSVFLPSILLFFGPSACLGVLAASGIAPANTMNWLFDILLLLWIGALGYGWLTAPSAAVVSAEPSTAPSGFTLSGTSPAKLSRVST